MSQFLVNLGVVLLFTLVGGFFAAAEIALVSLRESQVQRLATERGKRGRRLADLVADPNRFLAAVQLAVTTAGFLSAGFGASQMSPQVAPLLVGVGLSQAAADATAFVLVTLLLVYLSLVLGELTPKRIALQRAEGIAVATAGVIDVLGSITRPFIWLLSRSTDLLVRAVGGDPNANKERMSEDELRGILASQSSLTPQERELIDDVFEAGEREVREVMVPRTEVEFLDATLPAYKAARIVIELPHSRYPVFRGSQDDVIGFVHIRDILAPDVADRGIRLEDLVREVLMLPGSKAVLPAMFEMRSAGAHLAIVVDEYGGTAGIVTLEDLVEELVGDIRDEYDVEERVQRSPGADLEVDGLLNLEDFAEKTGFALPEGPYETVAGYVVAELGELPEVGTSVEVANHVLTVTELDGRRAARIRVSRAPVTGSPGADPVVGESPA
ncbi:MAG: hemolysin family protein [Actinomycetales bacterium]|nr:hemolysin family protein [Actinomycetales bacterium]